jgi:adenylate kinase family enzyme
MRFPIFKTKVEGVAKRFDLRDPEQTREYFQLKAGEEIEKLRKYLEKNTFVAYFLGKKNSGKGTYSKMFAEIVAPEKIDHFSIGDMVRGVDQELRDKEKRKKLISYLEKNYRGPHPLEEIIYTLEHRSTKELLPTELILVLAKREMERREKKTIFIDGFPRELDQVGISLFFRDLIGHRDDPDVFVLIDVPEKVIDERIKWRRVCPKCNTPKNLKLLPTKEVIFENGEFHLICDNCKVKMVKKEGDELGIEPIRERLKKEEEIMKNAMALYGIPKIFLRNSIPVSVAKDYVDDYEITPEYSYELKEGKVIIKEKPWIFKDDEGVDSFSLLPQPVVFSFIKQLVEVLNL